jgi:CDP-diacylglycerol---serine O-phosphatidyltransferase
MEQATELERPPSLLRTFSAADVLTLGNGLCGAGALLALLQHVDTEAARWLWVAFTLFPLAALLDFADGRVARLRDHATRFGAELDSLADVISFGVAPMALGFVLGMRGSMDVLALLFFVACGISRLARFNVSAETLSQESGKVQHFEGTPIPTSVLIVGVLAVLAGLGRVQDDLLFGRVEAGFFVMHPLVLLYVLSGSLMISRIRVPKL